MAASSNQQDIDDEISAIDAQIEELNRRKRQLVSERQRLRRREEEIESEKLQSKSWDGKEYKWSASLDECLRSTFGITGRGIWSLSWVGLTIILTVPPPCPAAMTILPHSHLPQTKLADSGTTKNVNPTQIHEQMPHTVQVTDRCSCRS